MDGSRLDNFLFKNNYINSRNKAQELIKNKKVLVNLKIVNKCNYQVKKNDQITIVNDDGFVSRAAYKLKYGIDFFNIDLNGKICLDIGSSTGGFTQICLLNNAAKVYSIDVGTNQMHESLKTNKKVQLYEKLNFKDVRKDLFKDKINFICCDVSFISLTKILNKLEKLNFNEYESIFLIKPQYEYKTVFNKSFSGIVRKESERNKIVNFIKKYMIDLSYKSMKIVKSPIVGKDGNIEYLIYAKK